MRLMISKISHTLDGGVKGHEFFNYNIKNQSDQITPPGGVTGRNETYVSNYLYG